MLHIILFRPEIPQNTGNIGRLCAVTKARLHLIYPLGFKITDKNLKRSGMDYWNSLDVHHHDDWGSFKRSDVAPKRIFMFTTKTTRPYWDVTFEGDDGLLFGNEGAGCPPWLHDEIGEEGKVTIPQYDTELRSLNLSTSVGIAAYEVMRQWRP